MYESKSVVIRGAIKFPTHPISYIDEVVSSIRSWFDGELIISTWEDQREYLTNISGVDKIVYTKDPKEGPIQQWKRQAVSYRNGFLASSGDVVMVTRSDICHYKDPFSYLNKFRLKCNDDLNLFNHKLIVSNMMSIRPNSYEYPNTFRISDWFQIGYRADIDIWSNILHIIDEIDPEFGYVQCTEKLWLLSALKSKYEIDLKDSTNVDHLNFSAILNNFIILNTRSTLGAYNKNWEFQPEDLPCYITESDFVGAYNENCTIANGIC
jgi:hypothetical protein